MRPTMLVSRKLNFSNTSQVESYYVAKLSPLDDGDQSKIDPEKVEGHSLAAPLSSCVLFPPSSMFTRYMYFELKP